MEESAVLKNYHHMSDIKSNFRSGNLCAPDGFILYISEFRGSTYIYIYCYIPSKDKIIYIQIPLPLEETVLPYMYVNMYLALTVIANEEVAIINRYFVEAQTLLAVIWQISVRHRMMI